MYISENYRKADVNHALILNLAIIALIALVIILTQNPLALLAIVLLREMPFGLLAQDSDDEGGDESGGRPIGFIQTDD